MRDRYDEGGFSGGSMDRPVEPNSADPSRSFPPAANPPCRHRKALSLCSGLSISWSGKRNFAG